MALNPSAKVLENAKILGQAAALAYDTPEMCESWAVAQGFTPGTLESFDADDTEGFVVQNETDIVVAFRGTQPNRAMDWLSDVRALQGHWARDAGKVHRGFYHALEVVWRNSGDTLPKRLINRGNRRVWITGHSLGGALAELCAARACFDPGITSVPIEAVYTFGQPRVGDADFATLLHDKMGVHVHRFVNDCDIVPRVPFFTGNYRHYGNVTLFNEAGEASDETSSVETLKAAIALAKGALSADALKEIGHLVADVIKGKLHGLSLESLEDVLHERLKTIAQESVENISDHDMRTCYLDRLKAPLATV